MRLHSHRFFPLFLQKQPVNLRLTPTPLACIHTAHQYEQFETSCATLTVFNH